MPETYKNGNVVFSKEGKWYYRDDGTEADYYKPCPNCGKMPTKEGHDACIANLPGVQNACCGHGRERGYIQFTDGRVIRFYLTQIEE